MKKMITLYHINPLLTLIIKSAVFLSWTITIIFLIMILSIAFIH